MYALVHISSLSLHVPVSRDAFVPAFRRSQYRSLAVIFRCPLSTSGNRMRILIVTTSPPYPTLDGSRLRDYNLLKHLSPRHELHLMTFADPGDVATDNAPLTSVFASIHYVPLPSSAPLNRYPLSFVLNKINTLVASVPPWIQEKYSSEFQSALLRLCSASSYDVVYISSVWMAQFTVPPPHPALLDMCDSPSLLLRRKVGNEHRPVEKCTLAFEWYRTSRYLRNLLPSYPHVSVCSPVDATDLRRQTPTSKIYIVPNGVNADYFSPSESYSNDPSICFSGVMDYGPNADAVDYLCGQILPALRTRMPSLRLVVAGRHATPATFPQLAADSLCLLTGTVPDLRPYIRSATVYVSPLRIGAGVKNKILEALAMEKAVVATSLSCEGLDVVHGRHLLVADTIRDFTESVLRLLQDAELRKALGRNGRQLVLERYSWTTQSALLEDLLCAVALQN